MVGGHKNENLGKVIFYLEKMADPQASMAPGLRELGSGHYLYKSVPWIIKTIS